MVENCFTEFREIIKNSSLSEEEKNFWFNTLDRLERINDAETQQAVSQALENVLLYLREEPTALRQLTELLQKKMGALEQKDDSLWQKAVEQEKGVLEES